MGTEDYPNPKNIGNKQQIKYLTIKG